MIYFDNAATTQVDIDIVKKMAELRQFTTRAGRRGELPQSRLLRRNDRYHQGRADTPGSQGQRSHRAQRGRQ